MELAVYLLLRAMIVLPEPLRRAAAEGAARLVVSLPVEWVNALPMKNLQMVRPGTGRRRGRAILRGLLSESLVNFTEAARMFHWRRLGKMVEVSGMENLEKALAQGGGVVLLTAHLGNFPLILAVLRRRDLPINYIGRDPSNRWLGRYFERVRIRTGLPVIPQNPASAATRAAVRWLRQGGILSLPADQYNSRDVPGALFFGYERGTPAGPAFFARRLGCAVVPAFITRHGGRHRLRIQPELKTARGGDAAGDIRHNAALFNRVLEKEIEAAPGQWLTLLTRRFRKSPGN